MRDIRLAEGGGINIESGRVCLAELGGGVGGWGITVLESSLLYHSQQSASDSDSVSSEESSSEVNGDASEKASAL